MGPTARKILAQEQVDRAVRGLISTYGEDMRWYIAEALAIAALQTAHGVGLDDAEKEKESK
jgi:hypothetical protein